MHWQTRVKYCACILVASCLSVHFTAAAIPPPGLGVRSPDGAGGGEYVFQPGDELSPELRKEIWAAVRENIRRLDREGKLPPPVEAHPLLGWPLRLASGGTDPGYHGISNFVDQDPSFPNHLKDYTCGFRTYDRSDGYNHQGDDIFLWPFPWRKMDHSEVEIVAAAPGTIVYKADGNFDRSCGFNTNPWNTVYVRHADNSMAVYGHMKNGSPTSKGVGDSVAEGEYLGVVGSSGNSTGPHLHFELYDSFGSLNEAFQGPCNLMNADSWWRVQPPYNDSAVNHIATGVNTPTMPACPNAETPNEASAFTTGNTIFFVSYYRDELWTLTSNYRILRPDNSVYTSWSRTPGVAHTNASWWYSFFTNFAPSGPAGTWQFEVTFNGQTYTRPFTINLPPASASVPDRDGTSLALRASRSGDVDVTLTWSGSCVATDTDYEVYEGILGEYYSHDWVQCSTGGATTVTVSSFSDAEYYLVVPTNGLREGSYGTDGDGVELPLGISTCHPQLATSCP